MGSSMSMSSIATVAVLLECPQIAAAHRETAEALDSQFCERIQCCDHERQFLRLSKIPLNGERRHFVQHGDAIPKAMQSRKNLFVRGNGSIHCEQK
jgi:hypothetical protein